MTKDIIHQVGSDEEIMRFTFELGQLKREARRGWQRIGESPESVAEHSQRAACLGYLIAHREGFADPNLIATMILFHDIQETRVGDIDKIQRRYLKIDQRAAISGQTAGLGLAGELIFKMWLEVELGETEAAIIAKDAEILEMVFTARELVVKGNKQAQEWIDSSRQRLKTKTAKELLEEVNGADPSEWWKEIGNLQPLT
ncbi:MAG TPA: HD domain-containing protein [Oligoflexia bacterium]|nr:HD domain-containing protein [Oligoflexia bacterium]HMP27141.1 HD domain-containing protein [Oligoflexia bacterium]